MMLDTIKELKSSISEDQLEDIALILGNDLYPKLSAALEASSEDEAESRIADLKSGLGSAMGKVFKVKRVLRKDQMALVLDLISGNE